MKCEDVETKLRSELGDDETDGAWFALWQNKTLATRYACTAQLDGEFTVEALEKIVAAMKRVQ